MIARMPARCAMSIASSVSVSVPRWFGFSSTVLAAPAAAARSGEEAPAAAAGAAAGAAAISLVESSWYSGR